MLFFVSPQTSSLGAVTVICPANKTTGQSGHSIDEETDFFKNKL